MPALGEIRTETSFAGNLFLLIKMGENLLREVPSETLKDLVLSLKTVKRNYIRLICASREGENDG